MSANENLARAVPASQADKGQAARDYDDDDAPGAGQGYAGDDGDDTSGSSDDDDSGVDNATTQAESGTTAVRRTKPLGKRKRSVREEEELAELEKHFVDGIDAMLGRLYPDLPTANGQPDEETARYRANRKQALTSRMGLKRVKKPARLSAFQAALRLEGERGGAPGANLERARDKIAQMTSTERQALIDRANTDSATTTGKKARAAPTAARRVRDILLNMQNECWALRLSGVNAMVISSPPPGQDSAATSAIIAPPAIERAAENLIFTFVNSTADAKKAAHSRLLDLWTRLPAFSRLDVEYEEGSFGHEAYFPHAGEDGQRIMLATAIFDKVVLPPLPNGSLSTARIVARNEVLQDHAAFPGQRVTDWANLFRDTGRLRASRQLDDWPRTIKITREAGRGRGTSVDVDMHKLLRVTVGKKQKMREFRARPVGCDDEEDEHGVPFDELRDADGLLAPKDMTADQRNALYQAVCKGLVKLEAPWWNEEEADGD